MKYCPSKLKQDVLFEEEQNPLSLVFCHFLPFGTKLENNIYVKFLS